MEGLRLVAAGRSPWLRLAAPAAFLLAATLAVAVVRMQLADDDPAPAAAPAASAVAAKPAKQAASAERRFYAVKAGDTLESIARTTGVPVERLRELNPALEPTALFIGAKIRLR